MSELNVFYKDNLDFLKNEPDNKYDLIYIDPPFNTGHKQIRGDESKYGGYEDSFDDFLGFLRPRMIEAYRILKSNGSFFFHLDYREIHYCKVMLDEIFGRDSFINEIIWAYDFGARTKKKWPAKHDNILFYAKDPKDYVFKYDEIDRIPYMTQGGLVSQEKLEKGKTLTDVWWNTIVPTTSKENHHYATQKPLKILERIVKVHSNEDDQCLDFFAGSGSFGEACLRLNRNCNLVDKNDAAISVMKTRFETYKLLNNINFI